MILTDTSVLIRHFRTPTPQRTSLFRTIAPVVCGVTVTEVLAGARTPAQLSKTQSLLAFFGRIPTPEGVWDTAGRNQAHLASRGLTVPLPDTVIATVAVDAGLELWTYDTHFATMAALLPGLNLFQEPP